VTQATPDRTALTDKVLSQAVFTATIDAPIEKIDIYEWLRTLPDQEYQRCAPPDHKAAGYTVTDDGRPMSINVEMIGTSLVVQHYVYETADKDHCHMVSTSDVLTPAGWTTCQVIWDLKADPVDGKTSKYTNTVTTRRRSSWSSSRPTGRRSKRPPPPVGPRPAITAAARRRCTPRASAATPTPGSNRSLARPGHGIIQSSFTAPRGGPWGTALR
jgi:hypothetical protein